MSVASDKVFSGFTRLSTEEQRVVVAQLNDYLEKDSSGKRELRESVAKRAGLDLGPVSFGGCPCCGR